MDMAEEECLTFKSVQEPDFLSKLEPLEDPTFYLIDPNENKPKDKTTLYIVDCPNTRIHSQFHLLLEHRYNLQIQNHKSAIYILLRNLDKKRTIFHLYKYTRATSEMKLIMKEITSRSPKGTILVHEDKLFLVILDVVSLEIDIGTNKTQTLPTLQFYWSLMQDLKSIILNGKDLIVFHCAAKKHHGCMFLLDLKKADPQWQEVTMKEDLRTNEYGYFGILPFRWSEEERAILLLYGGQYNRTYHCYLFDPVKGEAVRCSIYTDVEDKVINN